MTASTTTALAGNGSFNLASLPAAQRAAIEADKKACWIRYKCRNLPLSEKRAVGEHHLAAVPESARDAVVQALKARGSR